MSRWLAVVWTVLFCGAALAADPSTYPKPEPNTADEPMAKKFCPTKAANFLDATSVNWSRDRRCVTCHTNVPYLMARPALGTEAPALDEVRKFFEEQVTGPEEVPPHLLANRGLAPLPKLPCMGFYCQPHEHVGGKRQANA